ANKVLDRVNKDLDLVDKDSDRANKKLDTLNALRHGAVEGYTGEKKNLEQQEGYWLEDRRKLEDDRRKLEDERRKWEDVLCAQKCSVLEILFASQLYKPLLNSSPYSKHSKIKHSKIKHRTCICFCGQFQLVYRRKIY